ncbi:MAG: ABC transporter permease [Chloroflexi bacterium]|nr:ABC transporter permease [Chloroflexota bacterium]
MPSPIILRLAGRYMRRRSLQSVLFILGVALGVAVVVAIDVANASSGRAFALSAESVTGRATHQIIGGATGLPSELYRQIRLDLGLRDAAPIVEDYVLAADLDDLPLRLFGVDPFAEPPFRSYLETIDVAGENENAFEALTQFIAEPGAALISQTLADRYAIAAGDTLALRAGDQRTAITVIGLLQAGDNASAQAIDNLILTDIATAQELVGAAGTISRIDLILPDGYDLDQIRALMPPGATLTTPQSQSAALSQMTAAFELNLQALSLLALVVGVFLIYNTVTFSVVQRRSILGVLRALGATRNQVFALILTEAVILGAIGTLIGLGLGVIFGRAAVGLVAQTISDLYFTVNVQSITVPALTLLKGAGIGVLASVGAALVPSVDATRTPPAGSLRRSALEAQTIRLLPFITAAAVAMNGIGVLLLQVPTPNLLISFGALFFLIVGGALFTPLALVIVMRLASPVAYRIFGVLGHMAPRAVVRSLSRTSVAVAALTVAVSVIVGVSVMIASFRGTVADWLETTLGADIYVSPPLLTAVRATDNVDAEVAARVAAVDGVERVVVGRQVNVAAPDFPELPPINLVISTGELVSGQRRFVWTNVEQTDYWPALEDGAVMVSEPFAFRRDITPENNTIRLLTDSGPETFTVVGVYYDYTTDQGAVFMADNVYRQHYDDPYISTVSAFIEPDAALDTVLAAIRSEALAGTDLLAQSNRDLRANVFEVFERTFAITGALRLLATVVAFIGILSALLALQLEQTRQYGVMRAVGMTGRQLWQYTLLQTGLMGGVAGLLALPIGLVLAVVLVFVINVRSFGWTLQMILSADEFILAFAVAVIAALAAGVYPAGRIARLLPMRALRSE